MQPHIEFDREKIRKDFGSLPKFAKAYGISFGVLRYRLDNPYYIRMLVSDKVFRAFEQMEKDGYVRIVKWLQKPNP
ncbi:MULTISPECIES: hypothetical protein [Helicobacter]|uniref:Uncharacterized protein n=1 Tax=Helicobacter suis TaxID=104628 RepID=A0A510HBW1_9HELI|nr:MULTISPECIES: hypothetical protein [Helicobacter]CRF49704.1 hypothetical protein HHE03_13650 [Helicobacter heilmannii]BCD45676.1 hypothetical protein NHP190020_07150 [Helicobacter suis]BCD46713.1 hypothetical protein NHP190020_17520 [Helicobacter suis]BCD47379.1 hypothetical protein NHP194003_05830 [Helicobacter suis]BCD48487.1 hypothetical protein NHP194003_16910 [Helicobacter suis]